MEVSGWGRGGLAWGECHKAPKGGDERKGFGDGGDIGEFSDLAEISLSLHKRNLKKRNSHGPKVRFF